MFQPWHQLNLSQSLWLGSEEANDLRCIDPALRQILFTLGPRTLLVPVDGPNHRPTVDCASLTLEATRATRYQRQLLQSDIGVLMGSPSDGLEAFEWLKDVDARQFESEFPGARQTTQLLGPDGQTVFLLRCQDFLPRTERFSNSVLHGEGSILTLYLRKTYGGIWQCSSPPLKPALVSWLDITAVPLLRIPLRAQRIEHMRGSPFLNTGDLNAFYWAELFAEEQQVHFAADLQRFYRTESSPWLIQHEPEVADLIQQYLVRQARLPGNEKLSALISPHVVSDVLKVLKSVSTVRAQSPKDAFREFLRTRLEKLPPGSKDGVTSHEIVKRYYKGADGAVSLTHGQAEDELSGAISEVFGIRPCGKIKRWNPQLSRFTERRGYRLRWRSGVAIGGDVGDAGDGVR